MYNAYSSLVPAVNVPQRTAALYIAVQSNPQLQAMH